MYSVKTTGECDRCVPFPCPTSNYTCNPLLNAYDCVCAPGQTGYNCEYREFQDSLAEQWLLLPIKFACNIRRGPFSELSSPCSSYPCFNGGTCSEVAAGSYACTCVDGFTGAQCQHGERLIMISKFDYDFVNEYFVQWTPIRAMAYRAQMEARASRYSMWVY